MEGKRKAPQEEVEEDDFALFSSEMKQLGLPAPLPEESFQEERVMQVRPAVPKPPDQPAGDRELFLSALGRMDETFADDWPGSESSARAEPRRMRQVRLGKLSPQAEVDLHGLTRSEARRKVHHFLENASFCGLRTVLLVTGRGLGSAGEPVLRKEIEKLLVEESAPLVIEWGRAPQQYGGEGAIIVFLRGRKERG